MKRILLVVAGLVAGVAFSAVELSGFTVGQDASGARKVTINYTLSGAAAIVTLSLETNFVNEAQETVWVTVDGLNVKTVSGDINKVVPPGSHVGVWKARRDWPGQRFEDGSIRAKLTAHSVYDPPDYAAIDLTKEGDEAISYFESASAVPGGVMDDLYKTTVLLMRRVHAANVRWRMGSPESEPLRSAVRETPRMVTLTEDYYLGVYELTQRQYELVTGAKRGSTSYLALPDIDSRPVSTLTVSVLRGAGKDWVTDGHAVDESSPLGVLRGKYGFRFDLPTSAQWEFACRAGTTTAFYNGQDGDGAMDWGYGAYRVMDGYGWNLFNNTNDTDSVASGGTVDYGYSYYDKASNKVVESSPANVFLHVVGKLIPNGWGFYDMSGNASEFCLDWYTTADNAVPEGEVVDPIGPSAASTVQWYDNQALAGGTCAGGGQGGYPSSGRSAARFTYKSQLACAGVRLCCPAVRQ